MGQSAGVRWLAGLALTFATASAAVAAPASDPAFLGIGMQDAPAGCRVTTITPGSPARDAGLHDGDLVVAIEGVRLGGQRPCDALIGRIADHRPGDKIAIDLLRGGERATARATLTSRGEMLSRRLVGEALGRTDLPDADDDNVEYDLSRRGQTRIIGWFTLASCTGCARTFDAVADRIAKRFKDRDTTPGVLAVTAPLEDLASYRTSFTAGVPLAVADNDMFDMLAMKDPQRITFMVVDCRGVVRFAAPVAPESEDVDAAIDEVLAAAEQAEHLRTVRR